MPLNKKAETELTKLFILFLLKDKGKVQYSDIW